MKRLGIGVIGCGEIAFTYHLPALVRLEQARLVATASRTVESARKAAQSFGIPTWYSDTAEMLADPDVEAVLILSPNFTHLELVEAAARAGKPMLVQKPLGRDEAECQAMLDAAKTWAPRATRRCRST